ncbi:MAG: type VI secretion system tip protein TssI/VgrG [Planctomycetota bacterium]|nr:type VI secretion system tip protein TssI/VgrG [Planctomycetota bacterium]
MFSQIKQSTRLLSIKTALGEDALAIRSLTLSEQLGRPFTCDLDLRCDDPAVNFEDVLGHPAAIRIERADGELRYVHGYIVGLTQDGVAREGRATRYRAIMAPWIWFLSRSADCRIFQNASVDEVILDVFRLHEFSSHFRVALTGTYPKREYIVQYRETALQFVTRLMEEHGIYYFFEHTGEGHTLVLADSPSAHADAPGCETVPWLPQSRMAYGRQRFWEWSVQKQLQTTTFAHTSYDFKVPKKPLLADRSVSRSHAEARFEVFDNAYPHVELDDGKMQAQVRLEELSARYETVHAEGDVTGLSAGQTFALEGFGRRDQDRKYLVVAQTIYAENPDYESGREAQGNAFHSSISALEASTPFRLARSTSKPVVGGPQTATVTGPSGEEIHVDPYGRVKVHFHWHRHDEKDENSSCWVRVSQGWAGKGWGAMFIPRIGQEVIVDFLEGDPDRPIITGRVYNGDQMPPYALPGSKNISTIQSRSTPGGGADNFNEIKFDDTKGSELFYVQAEKDRTVLVKNNNTETVGNDEAISIGHDRTKHVAHDETTTVDNNRTEAVGVNETISIGSNRTETVGVDETISIGSNRTETVGQTETVTIGLMRTHTIGVNDALMVGAAQQIAIGAAQTITVGAIQDITIGASQSLSVGASRDTSVGRDDTLTVGKKLVLEAGDSITLKTGKASITMKKDGTIVIKGKDITLDASGKINAKADGKITMKGQKILQN